MKKIISAILIGILFFVLFLLYNTYTFQSTQLQIAAIEKTKTPLGAVERFVEAIAIRTISYQEEEDFDSTQFQLYNELLKKNYPLIHVKCEHKIFNGFSHLFKWTGQNTNLDPIVLMAHHDVVPIASLPLWSVHPFEEGVKNDTIYGRGTMDDKCSAISILEAVEQLLREGFQPKRTIYLSLGHDEEIGGYRGAVPIASYLEEKGVKAAFVLDEGYALTKGTIPGIDKETAIIGIAEKGMANLELTVNMAGGHSSFPAKETSIDVLSLAVSKLKLNPFVASITPILDGFMDKIGPEMVFKSKFAIANRSIFKSRILENYEKTNTGNALVRTTVSPTIFEAGIKENVIPTSAHAIINFRILLGESLKGLIEHVTQVIGDERVNIELLSERAEPSPISPINTKAYTNLERSIKEIFPGVLTTPSLVVGGTDSRHFVKISPNIYRFVPFKITPENAGCFHGIDEHIPVQEYEDAIRFYRRLIQNGDEL